MRALAFVLLAIALASLAACAPQRLLLQPSTTPHFPQPTEGEPDYLYFVEQESGQDSRVMKCDIQPDNTVSCSSQYDLD